MENENSLKIESLVETNVGSKLATCLANVSYLPDELAYRLVKQEYKSFLYNIEKFEELNFLKEYKVYYILNSSMYGRRVKL